MSSTPAAWYPDPTGRHQLRYFDGQGWTDHVSNDGQQGHDPIAAAAPSAYEAQQQRVQGQVFGDNTGIQRGAGVTGPVSGGGGTIFTEPILVVNQKAKVMELTAQYAVFDQNGMQIAHVEQVGQSAGKKVLRALTSLDQFMTHHYEIRSPQGQPLLTLTRPRKVFKSTVVVTAPDGREVGRVVQENMVGKIHFALQANGQTIGAIRAENWRAWNFRLEDHTGAEVARITKTFEGFMKTAFTTADNYVVQIHAKLPEPLHTLVVASALSVDTALKQDARGFG
jgi:uncharacterized protein YxjI